MNEYKKYRFDFTKDVAGLMYSFTKEHRDETAKNFRANWNEWINREEIKRILTTECELLLNQGFKGDAWDKMYKSARYYYKKQPSDTASKHQAKQKGTKHTNRFSLNFLQMIDTNISKHMQDDKPQIELFNEFCETMSEEIIYELRVIKTEMGEIPEDIKEKLKKTYKNRFYKKRNTVV